MAKTKFFRIAVEGATVDGRVIDRNWIDEMAAGYNPGTYTARINCEHIAGFSPEPPFNSYGSVLALRATDYVLQLDGKPVTKRALEAQFDANDQLLSVNAKGQKLFTSCEISPNFAGTGKAGLVGLAITDNPASLGTEMLQFAASATVNPFSARKQDPANYISEALEADIALEEGAPAPASEITQAFAAMKTFFTSGFKKDETPPAPPPVETPPAPANDNGLAAFAAEVGKVVAAVETMSGRLDGALVQLGKLSSDHTALAAKIETTDSSNFRRPPAAGGAGNFATDC